MNAPSLALRPDAVRAWFDLAAVLRDMADAGQRPVCEWTPELWTSDAGAEDRAHAAELCQPCPARAACSAFAEANGEEHHVWGGRDFTPRRGRRPKAGAA